ncbi:phosphatase PAP2 family protein [Salinisphaera sp.]|uniref:phosphatase PAP2 family protein n=1 Tax=Salinisphaera sp. TaxID=1914330 RepID=UPI0025D7302B|nr:phosphatase PAP2 family protein [Salinisphaera sp.]
MTSLHLPYIRRLMPTFNKPLLIHPALILIAGLVVTRGFAIDRLWADALYRLEGGHWALRNAWFTARLLHEYGQRFSIVWGVGLLAFTALSLCLSRLRSWRRSLVCLCASVLSSLLLVSLSKHWLALPCPWDLQRYGGDLLGHAYALYPGEVGGCFPAGHAAGGYCLVGLYFLARDQHLQRPWLWLLPAAFIGPVYGLAQQLRGAHFLSHDLVSAALCWFVSYAVFALAGAGRKNAWPAHATHPAPSVAMETKRLSE